MENREKGPHEHWYVMSRNGRLYVRRLLANLALNAMHYGWEFGELYFEDRASAESYRDRWLLAGKPLKEAPKAQNPKLRINTWEVTSYPVADSSSASSPENVT